MNVARATMLILRGSPALSPFRLQKLRQDLAGAGVPIRAANAEFVHIAETDGPLGADDRAVLEKLLTYGPRRAAESVQGATLVVAPRPGTLSPWSSKATDIARNCGLRAIRRIERVIQLTLDLGGEDEARTPAFRASHASYDSLRAGSAGRAAVNSPCNCPTRARIRSIRSATSGSRAKAGSTS